MVSFSNTTLLTVFLNGITATFKTLSFDDTTNGTRPLGEKAQVSIGSSVQDSEYAMMRLDNFTIDQVVLLDPEQLYSDGKYYVISLYS